MIHFIRSISYGPFHLNIVTMVLPMPYWSINEKSEDFSLESQTQPNKPYFDRKDSKVEEVMLYPERSKNPKWQHSV